MSELLIDPRAIARLPESAGRQLLRYALEQPMPRESRRVFVNRTLRMESIRYVGFDLDWTLAAYDQDAISQLAFEMTLERLVERFDYPRAVLSAEYRADFTRRGLLVDVEAGTVIKMNRHRYVGRAFLGRHFLEVPERARLYRREPINPASPRFAFVDTLFELPEFNIYAELVEMSRRHGVALPPYPQLAKDVRSAIDEVHADGTLKRHILADLERFLPIDPDLILGLRRLALGGRKLMLITNSEWFFTDAICHYLFDNALPGVASWREIFDLVIVDARKPGFFRRGQPFVALDDEGRPGDEVAAPSWGGVYAGGSRSGLMRLIDDHGEQVLYVGDHIYGDILSTKMASTWRTCLVVSELEEELETLRGLSAQLRVTEALRTELADLGAQMDDLRDVLTLYRELAHNGAGDSAAGDPAAVQTEAMIEDLRQEHKALRQHTRRVQTRISKALNPYWGSLFKQGSNKSFFGAQVENFACVYTSRVSNFAAYGSNHYFRVLKDSMMHEWVV